MKLQKDGTTGTISTCLYVSESVNADVEITDCVIIQVASVTCPRHRTIPAPTADAAITHLHQQQYR